MLKRRRRMDRWWVAWLRRSSVGFQPQNIKVTTGNLASFYEKIYEDHGKLLYYYMNVNLKYKLPFRGLAGVVDGVFFGVSLHIQLAGLKWQPPKDEDAF